VEKLGADLFAGQLLEKLGVVLERKMREAGAGRLDAELIVNPRLGGFDADGPN